MMNRTETITSVHNPRVKRWASLQERKGRKQEGCFLVEGIHLVQEALASGAPVEAVLCDEARDVPVELLPYADASRTAAADGEQPEWIGVTDAIIRKLSETETPQPVIAVVRKPALDPGALFGADMPLVVAVDGVQDPGNLGTIIRSADAVGATGVVLGRGTVDVYNAKTVRSTMGSLFHLPVVEADLLSLLPEAKGHGMRLASTSLQASHSCYGYEYRQPLWLIVGNEGQGVSPAVQALVDDTLIIPMRGQAESLNVAMATTVLLYEAMRQRHYTI
ncbi:RNA methyltransferase [Paenibacillus thiaminolyticus]|uniref:TrmH family RNA methyltransferase n=1 Tax=Paenibacillus thiaminolyticus TaxID=49283 RepID=UPI002350E07A|nr:RNA methyltransferase [Paenibacillus thiaminolyticus]WCR24738.1 RNA methyltransferase [Paenibacillus thiaminolyticus]